MTIATWESEQELRIENVRQYSRAHPRCGTSFLLVVAVVAILVFTALGTAPLWWHITSRIVFIPVIAAIAYEAIRFGGTHRHIRLVNWLFAPNLWLQALTTRMPKDDQIEIAIAAMEAVVAQELADALAGGGDCDVGDWGIGDSDWGDGGRSDGPADWRIDWLASRSGRAPLRRAPGSLRGCCRATRT